MTVIRTLRAGEFRSLAFPAALISGFVASAGVAMGQAYTYDEPTCGATYREEAAKPQQLRVVWEMSAGQKCVEQSKFPLACRHFQAAITASERMPAEAGGASDLKTYLKTMMKTNGCQ